MAHAEATETTEPTTEETPVPALTFGPAPATLKRLATGIDVEMAVAMERVARENETGVTTNIVYGSTDTDNYKSDVKTLRKNLATRITEDERVAVIPFANGDGVSFSLAIKKRTKREPKPATE